MTPPHIHPDILKSVSAESCKRLKWTRRNDEWVQVLCEIYRGPNGLSDNAKELSK